MVLGRQIGKRAFTLIELLVVTSGDTIQIAAGVYYEQVVVSNKNLTLSGSPGAVLRATPYMQFSLQYVASAYLVSLLGIFKSDVTISGLTLEGEHLAEEQPNDFIDIWFHAAGGRVEDCRIVGFRGDTFDTLNGGWGVKVDNPQVFGFGQVNLDILRSTFADDEVSIQLQGDKPTALDKNWSPELSTTFAVDDSLIVGNSPDAAGAQFGIWITAGAGGEVKRNTISNYSYTGTNSVFNDSLWAFGVLAVTMQ